MTKNWGGSGLRRLGRQLSTTSSLTNVALIVAASLGAAALSAPAVAGTIFVYERADGTRLITDHKRMAKGYRLVKTYGSGRSTRLSHNYRRPLTPKNSRYDQMIHKVAKVHGVDAALVRAVVQVESSFNPGAVSNKGATGLMQLMPATARRFGVQDRIDPYENVDGGVRYLRFLLELFQDDVRLALAAYNAGEGAVKRYNGIPPYPETRDYVRKVMDLHRLYANAS